MKSKRAIVWFRSDLRIHDNESLVEALASAETVIPIYIFDDRVIKGRTSYGFKKTGVYRAKFIIETIADLRKSLEGIGLPLLVKTGNPEDIIFNLADQYKTSWVFCNRERTQEEVDVQDALESKLWTIGQEVRYNRGKMLYHTGDLPFPVTHTPESFTGFRKEVEKYIPIRDPLAVPKKVLNKELLPLEIDEIPDLSSLGYTTQEISQSENSTIKGGESEGFKRLHYYLWETNLISSYKETRNGLLGKDFSSRFSAYLSHGSLSPKRIYQEVKKYESEVEKNDSSYWLIFELLWRDYFRLIGKKFGNKIFQFDGLKEPLNIAVSEDKILFSKWSKGITGIPFIDANMLELNSTGFMSNRGRQNVASFLVNDMGINWKMGAEYFESLLIDYDPCSNYGNWNYIAGVGCDPRENRYFNVILQTRKYDPQGAYIKSMLPILQEVPFEKLLIPGMLTLQEQKEYNVLIGENYPSPILHSEKWN